LARDQGASLLEENELDLAILVLIPGDHVGLNLRKDELVQLESLGLQLYKL
jgi:hypothetical protein